MKRMDIEGIVKLKKTPRVKRTAVAMRTPRLSMSQKILAMRLAIKRQMRLLRLTVRRYILRSRYRLTIKKQALRNFFGVPHIILQDIKAVVAHRELLQYKTKCLLLVIMLAFSNVTVQHQKGTLSFFTDVEASSNNSYGAAVLDMVVTEEPFVLEFSHPKKISRPLTVSNVGLLPFQFDAHITNIQGPAWACDSAYAELSDDDGLIYSSPIDSFVLPASTLATAAHVSYRLLVVSLTDADAPDDICTFDVVWRAWQTDIANFDVSQGYTDEEQFNFPSVLNPAAASLRVIENAGPPPTPDIVDTQGSAAQAVVAPAPDQPVTEPAEEAVETPAPDITQTSILAPADEPAEVVIVEPETPAPDSSITPTDNEPLNSESGENSEAPQETQD